MTERRKPKIGRPKNKENLKVFTAWLEEDMISILRDMAALESITRGRTVSSRELVRDALRFVYFDNERLRECFRRTREVANRRKRRKRLHPKSLKE